MKTKMKAARAEPSSAAVRIDTILAVAGGKLRALLGGTTFAVEPRADNVVVGWYPHVGGGRVCAFYDGYAHPLSCHSDPDVLLKALPLVPQLLAAAEAKAVQLAEAREAALAAYDAAVLAVEEAPK